MVTYPTFDLLSRDDFKALFFEQSSLITAGALSDLSDPTLIAIAERQAIVIERLLTLLNRVFPLVAASALELSGATRSVGSKAVCSPRFLLTGVFTQKFVIPKNYRFAIGGFIYTTDLELVIPANTDSSNQVNYALCRVTATAVQTGLIGNKPATECTILDTLPGLAKIFIDEAAKNGKDAETADEFFARVSELIAGRLTDPTLTALTTSGEFENAAENVLGFGSIVIAILNINSTLTAQELGAVHILGINPDYSALTNAQRANLSSQLGARAIFASGRVYVSSLSLQLIVLKVYVTLNATANFENTAIQIKDAAIGVINPKSTLSLKSLDPYKVITAVYQLSGVSEASISWALDGDPNLESVQLPLPLVASGTTQRRPAKLKTITVIDVSGTTKVFAV